MSELKEFLANRLKSGLSFNAPVEGGIKRKNLHHLYNRRDKLLIMAYDHGLEHGPEDFLENPESADPNYILHLAVELGVNAIVLQAGIAGRYWHRFRHRNKLPLILKLNGKTKIAKSEPYSACTATVEDAVKLGARAVGYTLYFGSEYEHQGIENFSLIRRQAELVGLPVIMWAYPRGRWVKEMGGASGLAVAAYAARAANELGADFVKLAKPKKPNISKYIEKFGQYNKYLGLTAEEGLRWLVECAGNTRVLLVGGPKDTDVKLEDDLRAALASGVEGIVMGRNLWQRSEKQAMLLVEKLRALG